MIVCLLRHGRTRANDLRLYCGSTDLPLSDAGRAGLIALRNRGVYPAPDGFECLTSGMRRTEETFRILYGEAPVRACTEFREIDFGTFEMRGYDELKDDAGYRVWIADSTGDAAPPGGESANHFRARIIAAADALRGDSLIVCHGGVIAALMAYWFPDVDRHMYAWQPDFGCGYRVEISEQRRSYTKIG